MGIPFGFVGGRSSGCESRRVSPCLIAEAEDLFIGHM